MRSTTFLAAAVLLLGARAENTEQQQAAITDPTAECAPYSNAVVDAAKASLPPPLQIVAGVLASDTAGQAKFNAMKGNIPNIALKGADGNFGNTTLSSYPPADPDCWWSANQCVTPKVAGLKGDIFNVPEPRTLGYGFDDGPNCSHNAFYDYLTSKQQKATMFYIGSNVLFQPLEAQRAVADGHEICVHSWSHHAMTTLTNEQAFGELWYTMEVIRIVTGVTPTCWRPPQGDVDDRIRFIAQQLGLDTILWKYDAFDWKVASGQATPDQVQANYDSIVADAKSGTFDTVGAIMLMHELDNYTMQTTIDNYPKLAAAFDHIVPVGVAFNKTQPYAETNYSQPNFAAYVSSRSSTGGSSGSSGSNGSSGSIGSGGSSGSKSPSQSGSGSNSQATGTGAGVPLRVSQGGVLALGLAVLGAALTL